MNASQKQQGAPPQRHEQPWKHQEGQGMKRKYITIQNKQSARKVFSEPSYD